MNKRIRKKREKRRREDHEACLRRYRSFWERMVMLDPLEYPPIEHNGVTYYMWRPVSEQK